MDIAYNPYSETVQADPWPVYRRMRDEAPAYFIEELNAWALSRFEDVWQASMNRDAYTATRGTSPGALLKERGAQPSVFLFMDPPEHRSHRDLISAPYQREAVALLDNKIRTRTRQLLEPALARGELDVHALATQVALRTTADFIGLPLADIEHIRALIDIFYHREPGFVGTTPAGMQAFADARAYIMNLIRQFRAEPPAPSTHIRSWLDAAIDDSPMSDENIYFSIFALTITGSDTLPLSTAGTIYYLSQHPEQLAAVRADPTLIAQAFAETTRYDQATNLLGRTLVRDVELHGQTLRKDQSVLFLFASANRDDREFEQPDRFDITRRPRRTLSFGAGLHACLGQHVARLEGRIILEEVFAAIPDFAVDARHCKRVFGEFLQGWCQVPMLFRPR